VPNRRHTDFLAGLEQLENHVRARERFAGAGRALDRQHAVLELKTEPQRIGQLGVDAVGAGREPFGACRQARRPAQQQIACRAMRTRRVDAVRRNPLADLEQHAWLGLRSDVAFHEHAAGPDLGVLAGVLDVECVRADVELLDPADLCAVRWHADVVAAAQVVVLRWERVAVNRPPRRAACGGEKFEARERRALLCVVLEWQIA
jgi:hypothetical protein